MPKEPEGWSPEDREMNPELTCPECGELLSISAAGIGPLDHEYVCENCESDGFPANSPGATILIRECLLPRRIQRAVRR